MLCCKDCGVELVVGDNYKASYLKVSTYWCDDCKKKSNDTRMYVNGKYIPVSHPLYQQSGCHHNGAGGGMILSVHAPPSAKRVSSQLPILQRYPAQSLLNSAGRGEKPSQGVPWGILELTQPLLMHISTSPKEIILKTYLLKQILRTG